MERELQPAVRHGGHAAKRRQRVRLHGAFPALQRVEEMARRAPVRKAVFPVSGLDSGFLPATKAAPKEMLTVVDKPLIHYAVEEAIAAGIREMVFVTSRHKRVIEDHFDTAYDLEEALEQERREELLGELRRHFPADVRYLYVRQRDYCGLGSALACARPLLEGAAFAVIVPDRLIDGPEPAIVQLVRAASTMRQPLIGVCAADGAASPDMTLHTATASCERTHHVIRLDHAKPHRTRTLMPVGRYVLTSDIFPCLARSAARTGVPDLLAALRELAAEASLLAYEIEGERFACNTKLGLLAANVHYGLRHPDVAAPFAEMLRRMQLRLSMTRFDAAAPSPVRAPASLDY